MRLGRGDLARIGSHDVVPSRPHRIVRIESNCVLVISSSLTLAQFLDAVQL
jgi:hypothetical protein